MQAKDRRHNGLALAAQREAVQQVAADLWQVQSQRGPGLHIVTVHTNAEGDEWLECACPDHQYRRVACKHMHAVLDTRAALAYCIEQGVAGRLDPLRTWLRRTLLTWLPVEQEHKYRVLWLASEVVQHRTARLYA